MAKKISSTKLSKMITLHLKGYSQSEIAQMLHMDQSTISKYIGKFNAQVEQKGMNTALLEFGIQDKPEDTQTVVEEFHASDLTITDVNIALQLDKLLQECGIEQKDYLDFMQVCKKTKDASYIEAANKLNNLENTTGMGYQEIVSTAANTADKLQKDQKKLENINEAISTSYGELAETDKKKKKVSDDLKTHMQAVAHDEQRLKKVEALALALKKAGIPDKSLPEYFSRQESLNKAGIGIEVFEEILKTTGVATKVDGGKQLLKQLTQYGGLVAVINEEQARQEQLNKEVGDLEQKAQFKVQLGNEIKKLKTDKSSLEPLVLELTNQKNELIPTIAQLNSNIESLGNIKAKLSLDINELQSAKGQLDDEIKVKQQETGDLENRRIEREKLLQECAELQAKVNSDTKRREIFESFLGLVQLSSMEELRKFTQEMPALIEEAEQGKYSPEFLRSFILGKLAGPELRILKCTSCQHHFYVDKGPELSSLICPVCHLYYSVTVDQDAEALVKDSLAKAKPNVTIHQIPVSKLPDPEGKTKA